MIWSFWPVAYRDITELQPKWRHLPFKNFGPLFEFDVYGIATTCSNFDALVKIWTIIDLKSSTNSYDTWKSSWNLPLFFCFPLLK